MNEDTKCPKCYKGFLVASPVMGELYRYDCTDCHYSHEFENRRKAGVTWWEARRRKEDREGSTS